MPDAERRTSRGQRFEVQPLSHDSPVLADSPSAVDRAQSPLVGMGGITEIATGSPGYCSVLPNTMAPIAKTLKLNGYATAQFGKCHEVPVWQTSPAGPFDAWPTAAADSNTSTASSAARRNQWYPSLYEGTTPIEVKKTPEEGYHFMDDMTDKAIGWIGQQKALIPDKPFFIYFAPGATHAPHHVPEGVGGQVQGQFDKGWDKLREETFARQKKLGVIPKDCELTTRHKEIPAWDEMPERYEARAAPPDGSLRGIPRVHRPPRRPAARCFEEAQLLDDTLVYLHLRRQRRVGRRHAQRHVQRDDQLQRRGRARDARVPDGAGSTSSAGPSPTITTRSVGRMR